MKFMMKGGFSTIKSQINSLKSAEFFNVPENIINLADRRLLGVENHPICIIK